LGRVKRVHRREREAKCEVHGYEDEARIVAPPTSSIEEPRPRRKEDRTGVYKKNTHQ